MGDPPDRRHSGVNGEFVTISRELWEVAVKALDSGDEDVRRDAFHLMLAAGVPTWDIDLDDEAEAC